MKSLSLVECFLVVRTSLLLNFFLGYTTLAHGWYIIKSSHQHPRLEFFLSLFSLHHGACLSFLQTCCWSIGQVPKDKSPSLSGNLVLEAGQDKLHVFPVFRVGFRIMGVAFSGLQIYKLDVKNTPSEPYKGFRALTRSGDYEVRAWYLYLLLIQRYSPLLISCSKCCASI